MESNKGVTGFCTGCEEGSTDMSPGNVSTVNGVGRKFYGSANPCGSCGSVVRTLWMTFADIPLVPRGSYRYKTAEVTGVFKENYWARKTATNTKQILMTYLVGWAVASVVLTGVFYVNKARGR